MSPAFERLKQQRPKSGLNGIKLLHDNARPHVHSGVDNFIRSEGVTIIDHPPYSPDLAPCDYWLFDVIKSQLGDYNNAEELSKAVTSVLKNIPKTEYFKTFVKYKERLGHCIEARGDYFEHYIK